MTDFLYVDMTVRPAVDCVMTTSPDECGAQLSSVYIELTRQVERTGSESQNCVSLVLFLD